MRPRFRIEAFLTGAWSLPLGTISVRAIGRSDRSRLPAVGLVPRGAPSARQASAPNSVSTHAYSASSCWPLARSTFSNQKNITEGHFIDSAFSPPYSLGKQRCGDIETSAPPWPIAPLRSDLQAIAARICKVQDEAELRRVWPRELDQQAGLQQSKGDHVKWRETAPLLVPARPSCRADCV